MNHWQHGMFKFTAAWLILLAMGAVLRAAEPIRPNILFISIDDLNDWIGCMGGHPQTRTPNMDRLAKSGVLFTNAHCAAPSCNPSRSAIFTGRAPNVSGLYANDQKMREILPKAEIIPKTFSRHGYYSAGSGKLLHYFIDAPSWDQYFPEAKTENPFPRTLYPKTRPLSLPVGGPWQYSETDWGPLEATDEEYGGDFLVSDWIGEQLRAKHDKPFFLGCGIYRPHEPWFVPAKYFEPFPLDSIQLPKGYREGDIDDLPPAGKRLARNRYLDHIKKEGQWKKAIQSYLASISYADTMVGRVLDALESGPNAGNTIVVLWSDHGWHLGEKEHWSKYTGWRACTRVPLMIRVPAGVPALPQGTVPGICDRPVSLLSLFPTLLDLCGLPPEAHHDGPSLLPLLKDQTADWPHVAMTYFSAPGGYALSTDNWRLIHYPNNDEELYNIKDDPHEWTNLAADSESAGKLAELRAMAPIRFAAKPAPSVASLPELEWHSASNGAVPRSRPEGNPFDVHFLNRSGVPVQLFWVDSQGDFKPFSKIAPGREHVRKTRPGAVWLIKDSQDKALGYFEIQDRSAKAIIPQADQPQKP